MTAADPSSSLQESRQRPRIANPLELEGALARHYPMELQRLGVGGRVRVSFLVNADGRPKNVRIEEGSGLKKLDEAAVGIVKEMRFEPALVDGRPVTQLVLLPVEFRSQCGTPPDVRRPPPIDVGAIRRLWEERVPAASGRDARVAIVEVETDSTGHPVDARIVRSAGVAAHDSLAVELIRLSSFEPVRYKGRAYPARFRSAVPFGAAPGCTAAGDETVPDTTRGIAPRLLNSQEITRALSVLARDPMLRGGKGMATLMIRIGEDGRAEVAHLVHSRCHADLDRVAFDLIAAMRFEPARLDGKPVTVWAQQPVVFTAH